MAFQLARAGEVTVCREDKKEDMWGPQNVTIGEGGRGARGVLAKYVTRRLEALGSALEGTGTSGEKIREEGKEGSTVRKEGASKDRGGGGS